VCPQMDDERSVNDNPAEFGLENGLEASASRANGRALPARTAKNPAAAAPSRFNCESGSVQSDSLGPVLTVPEAALLVRCSKAHLLNVIHGRVANVPQLPHIKMGRRIMIRRESLDRWLAAVEAGSEAKAPV
jgi:excisionase family DNA binding protein